MRQSPNHFQIEYFFYSITVLFICLFIFLSKIVGFTLNLLTVFKLFQYSANIAINELEKAKGANTRHFSSNKNLKITPKTLLLKNLMG